MDIHVSLSEYFGLFYLNFHLSNSFKIWIKYVGQVFRIDMSLILSKQW